MKISSIWHILPIIITLPLLVFSSCGGDSDDNNISKEEDLTLRYQNIQNEEYSKLSSILPGHWEAYEHYNTYTITGKKEGWEPISNISWDTSYIFNSDGTYIKHDYGLEYKGTYRLEKNSNYLKDPNHNCRVFLYLHDNNYSTYEKKYKILLEEEFLRLEPSESYPSEDYIFGPEHGGESSIRYKKK